MKSGSKFFTITFLSLFVWFLTTGDVLADDVLQAVRAQAIKVLSGLRPVIFILAGFGLIGFAWMAIFNKISWKWFANIAMGLFLVANMGLFIDYFATKSGQKGQYAEKLGYGDYMSQSGYTSTSGTDSEPQKQTDKGDTGTVGGKDDGNGSKTPNSSSDELENKGTCVPATGLNCDTSGSKTDTTDIVTCNTKGGVWNNITLKCETKAEADKKAAITDPVLCGQSGGAWKDGKCS